MKIKSLTYFDRNQEWGFEKITFFDLTLLVGVSGVGKSQILESIRNLQSISRGASFNGIEWEIIFSTSQYSDVIWQGSFENVPNEENNRVNVVPLGRSEEGKYRIQNEIITVDGASLVNRNGEFAFDGRVMPKLSSSESALNLLKEEDKVRYLYDSFGKIYFDDHTKIERSVFGSMKGNDEWKAHLDTLDKIKSSPLSHFTKLGLVYDNFEEVFNDLKNAFVDVFTQVEDVRIESVLDPRFKIEFYQIQIKEKYADHWIPQERISSGMIRTLLHLTEMKLCAPGSVILVDEIENSLGVNCINTLTDDLLDNDSGIQYIATSHHPYIISKIPYDNWKIITRKGGLITAHDAKDFDLGDDSHHERFMNLINLPAYKEGVSSL